MPRYLIQQGDCLSSIASLHGFDWKTIWLLPENSALRSKRNNPNLLLPGDLLFVRDKILREEDRPVEKRHYFVKKAGPTKLKICLQAAGVPLAGKAYVLTIGDQTLRGTTNSAGILEETIPPAVNAATLVLGDEKLEFQLRVGCLDPPTEISGVQGRLNNLGFHCGAVDGIDGHLTRSALLMFQQTYQLDQTGKPDAATCQKLRSQHGC